MYISNNGKCSQLNYLTLVILEVSYKNQLSVTLVYFGLHRERSACVEIHDASCHEQA